MTTPANLSATAAVDLVSRAPQFLAAHTATPGEARRRRKRVHRVSLMCCGPRCQPIGSPTNARLFMPTA